MGNQSEFPFFCNKIFSFLWCQVLEMNQLTSGNAEGSCLLMGVNIYFLSQN